MGGRHGDDALYGATGFPGGLGPRMLLGAGSGAMCDERRSHVSEGRSGPRRDLSSGVHMGGSGPLDPAEARR